MLSADDESNNGFIYHFFEENNEKHTLSGGTQFKGTLGSHALRAKPTDK